MLSLKQVLVLFLAFLSNFRCTLGGDAGADTDGIQIYYEVHLNVYFSNVTDGYDLIKNESEYETYLWKALNWTIPKFERVDSFFKKHTETSLYDYSDEHDDWLKIEYVVSIVDTDWIKVFKNQVRRSDFETTFQKYLRKTLTKKMHIDEGAHANVEKYEMSGEAENWKRRFSHFGIMVGIFCVIGVITIIAVWFYDHTDAYAKHKSDCQNRQKEFDLKHSGKHGHGHGHGHDDGHGHNDKHVEHIIHDKKDHKHNKHNNNNGHVTNNNNNDSRHNDDGNGSSNGGDGGGDVEMGTHIITSNSVTDSTQETKHMKQESVTATLTPERTERLLEDINFENEEE